MFQDTWCRCTALPLLWMRTMLRLIWGLLRQGVAADRLIVTTVIIVQEPTALWKNSHNLRKLRGPMQAPPWVQRSLKQSNLFHFTTSKGFRRVLSLCFLEKMKEELGGFCGASSTLRLCSQLIRWMDIQGTHVTRQQIKRSLLQRRRLRIESGWQGGRLLRMCT